MTALASALIAFIWQGLLIAGLLRIALLLLRNRSANARYVVSCAALFGMAAAPFMTMLAAVQPSSPLPVGPALTVIAGAAGHSPVPTPWFVRVQAWTVPVWCAGVLFFACRLLWGCRQIHKLKRCGTQAGDAIRSTIDMLAARMGLRRPVLVLMSTLTDVPGVVGVLRPVVLLPIGILTGLTPQQLEMILAHELAHIRRFDALVNALQSLVETLLFYHPAVWWTSARIRHERELCCDDLALGCCGNPLSYARALTELEKLRVAPAGMSLRATGGELFYRIRRIMGDRSVDHGASKLMALLAMILAAGCIGSFAQHGPGVQVEAPGAQAVEPIRYPAEAMKKGVQGTVVVQADVDEHGNVTDARVLSGPQELRRAALRPVLSWKFQPDGSPGSRQVSAAFQPPPAEEVQAALQAADQHKQEMLLMQNEMMALRSQLDELKRNNLSDRQRQIEASIAAMEEQLLALQQRTKLDMAGHKLARLVINGLSDERREELTRRLPVKVGDIFTPESTQTFVDAIRAFDDRLRFQVQMNDAAVVVTIALPSFFDERLVVNQLDMQIAVLEAQISSMEQTLTGQHPDILKLQAQLQLLRARREALIR